MPKLINVLAASLGSGLLLGAGFRLGEKLAGEERAEGAGDPSAVSAVTGELVERLGSLEGRLAQLETVTALPPFPEIDLSGLEARVAAQAMEVSAVRTQIEAGAERIETLSQTDERMRGELRGWVEERVEDRIRELETKLRTESKDSQREMLDAVVDSIQTRIIVRISKLEEEVSGQAAGMMDLRDCTLRTEDSMQKLLGGIDRLIAAQEMRPRPARTAAQPIAVPDTRSKNSAEKNNMETMGAKPQPPESAPQGGKEGMGPVKSGAPIKPVVMPSIDSPRRRWSIFG